MQRKVVALVEAKATSEGNGSIEGYASVFGGIDSYGDRIAPGAYAETLADFLTNGFLGLGHDWSLGIGMPRQAFEDEKGLYLVADYHSDEVSQRARTVAAERLAAGKSVGLSIGYDALAWEYQKVDQAIPTPWGGVTDKIRILKKIKLFEVSQVTIPADEAARAVGAKAGERFADQAGRVLADLEAFLVRAKGLAALRAGDGRELSAATRADLEALAERLEALAGIKEELAEVLASGAPEAMPSLEALYLDYMELQTRLAGAA